MLKRLSSDRSLAAFAGQFVPLKLTTDGNPQWSQWTRKYPHDGQAIPIVYVVRADGKKLYARSGGLEGAALPQLLLTSLRASGRSFNDAEAKLLSEAVSGAESALEADRHLTAARELSRLARLGKVGELNSHSLLALKADELAAQIASEGKQKLEAAQSQLKLEEQAFDGVLFLVEAVDSYDGFNALKQDAVQALRSAERNEQLAPLVSQAQALHKARRYAQNESATVRDSAVDAYERVIQRYPETQAAQFARSELAEIDPQADVLSEPTETTASSDSRPADPLQTYRTWTDSTGQFQIVAKLVNQQDGQVTLLKKDDTRIVLPLNKLSPQDQDLLKSARQQ